jgi:xanthine dehydrogenase small subunit
LEADRAKLKLIDELYPPEPMVRVLAAALDEPVEISAGEFRFFKPTSAQAAAKYRAENPSCLIVAGATDIGVQRNKGIRQIKSVMSVAGLKDLRQISVTDNSLMVGATATLTELEQATATVLPEFSRFLAYFGSPLIKNAGTLAGNLVNASPIGDTQPPLFVLDAEIELTSPTSSRWVNINTFYSGYRKTVLAADEIVTRVRIPLPAKDEVFKCYKVSKRKDLDISSFGAAIWMRRGGRAISEIRIAYGGVGPIVLRLPRTEEFLCGKTLSLELFEHAGKIAGQEVTPISDVRGSHEYRRLLAENILVKFWHDLDDGDGNAEEPVVPSAGRREPSLARSPEVNFP